MQLSEKNNVDTSSREKLESEGCRSRYEYLILALAGIIFVLVLQGVFYLSYLVYSLSVYRLFAFHPAQWVAGVFFPYLFFACFLTVFVFALLRVVRVPVVRLHRALIAASAVSFSAFPITPLLWYDDTYTVGRPSSGFVYGLEFQHCWLLVLVGAAMLIMLYLDRDLRGNSRREQLIAVLSFLLGLVGAVIFLTIISTAYFEGHLDIRATPFYLLTHLAGIALAAVSPIRYRLALAFIAGS